MKAILSIDAYRHLNSELPLPFSVHFSDVSSRKIKFELEESLMLFIRPVSV